MEERIALLEKAITDEMARVDTLRDMLIDAIKHQRIEKLEERIEKLEEELQEVHIDAVGYEEYYRRKEVR